jgi:fructose-1,6-bisphosphatase/inositol monophosphatase family enzyme
MEWDTAAADIIVKEAGGMVLQAGKITGKGELLEDWKVGLCGRKMDLHAVPVSR